MSDRRFALSLVSGAIGLVFLSAAFPAGAEERVAQLNKVDGNVSITRSADGKAEEAKMAGPRVRNGSVFGGDVVSTGPGSTATMLFGDGSQVDLKEKTSLTVQEIDLTKLAKGGKRDKPIGRKVRVLAGSVWTNVVPNAQVATEFETPSGVAAVKGTTFTITVEEEVKP
jgi:hypothetical protein